MTLNLCPVELFDRKNLDECPFSSSSSFSKGFDLEKKVNVCYGYAFFDMAVFHRIKNSTSLMFASIHQGCVGASIKAGQA